jgi:chromosome partitioning protein
MTTQAAHTTICFINQKGGCGKSSCCFHLAGCFAQAGFSVLVIDADPQGSLSQGFFGSSFVELLPPSETLAAAFSDENALRSFELIRKPTRFSNLTVICANHALGRYNIPPEAHPMSLFAIEQIICDSANYQIVLIDCPPNLYQCSWDAMLAADYIIVPVPPEDFGTQGLRMVHQGIERARQLNTRLQLLGLLVTRSDSRLLIHRSYERKLRQLYGSAVFETIVPEASAFKVALAQKTPVTFANPASKAASLTRELGHEILQRMNGATALMHVA